MYKIIPGHSLSNQDWVCVPFPAHGAPLFCGAGLVQIRLLLCIPTPHVAEHCVQTDQWLQSPSTEMINDDFRPISMVCPLFSRDLIFQNSFIL